MTWHADDLLDAYRARDLDAVATASVDTHLMSCTACREQLRTMDSAAPAGRDHDELWHAIVDEIDRPARTWPERLLSRAGVPDHVGRLLAASHSLALATVLSVSVSLLLALFAVGEVHPRLVATFVAVAAVVPAVGVSLAFGPSVDPAYEIGAASPLSGLRLVLVRTIAVVVSAIAVGLAGSVGLRHEGLIAVAWLLPSLALASATLAASTWVAPWRAGTVIVTTWSAGVFAAGRVSHDVLSPFGPTTQVGAVAVIAAATAVVLVRAPRLDHRET